VLPAWRRLGLGRALLRHSERRLREIAAGQPGDGPRVFEAQAADTQVGKEALLLSEGYTAVRHSYAMLRQLNEALPDAPLPAGLELRPVLPEHYELIRLASNEAFRDHWSDVPMSEEQFRTWLEDPDFDPRLWRVAWMDDQIAGLALNTINSAENREYDRKRGWMYSVCTLRQWRGRGLARALLADSLRVHAERGMTEVGLEVDTESLTGALRLYESVGFRAIKRSSFYRKPFETNATG
jgi:ribosomal protein S18 acetylase RimI-like enzyme